MAKVVLRVTVEFRHTHRSLRTSVLRLTALWPLDPTWAPNRRAARGWRISIMLSALVEETVS